jgi:hypothetical protein
VPCMSSNQEHKDFDWLMWISEFDCSTPFNSVVPLCSHGSSSLPFLMKVMVCHFVSDSHEVMTALIVVLPLIVVEISLQLHRSLLFLSQDTLPFTSEDLASIYFLQLSWNALSAYPYTTTIQDLI